MKDCIVCHKHRGVPPAPGGFVHEDDLVVATHVFDLEGNDEPSYLGHLVIEPRRHVPGLADLTPVEAEAVGRLLPLLARALVESEGAEHVYSAVVGHQVDHLHVHVFPRYPGTPPEFRFMRVDEAPNAPKGGADDIAAVTGRIRDATLRF